MQPIMLSAKRNSPLIKVLSITIIIAIAFSLRLHYINNTMVDTPLRADAKDYYSYAINMKNLFLYSRSWPSSTAPKPDALRSPGYPFFISNLVTWPPTQAMIWSISFWQALLDTLTVLMTFLLAKQFFGAKLALFTALITTISPHMISATSYILTETLFSFLMTASALSFVIAIKKKTHFMFLFAGALLALASLTRPTIQFFIIPLVISLFIARNSLHLNKKVLISLILGFFITYMPWTARNIHTLGITSDPTLTINTLHHGVYPGFMYQSIPETKGMPYRYDPRSQEIASSVHSALNEIYRRLESQPLQHLKWYLIEKPLSFFSWNIVAGYGDVFIYPITRSPYLNNHIFKTLHQVMYWLHWPLIALSLFACGAVWLPNKKLGMLPHTLIAIRTISLLMLYFIAVHIVGAPFPRYSIPLRPVTYTLAFWSVSFLIQFALTKGVSNAEEP